MLDALLTDKLRFYPQIRALLLTPSTKYKQAYCFCADAAHPTADFALIFMEEDDCITGHIFTAKAELLSEVHARLIELGAPSQLRLLVYTDIPISHELFADCVPDEPPNPSFAMQSAAKLRPITAKQHVSIAEPSLLDAARILSGGVSQITPDKWAFSEGFSDGFHGGCSCSVV